MNFIIYKGVKVSEVKESNNTILMILEGYKYNNNYDLTAIRNALMNLPFSHMVTTKVACSLINDIVIGRGNKPVVDNLINELTNVRNALNLWDVHTVLDPKASELYEVSLENGIINSL